ncbi:hypothetical protein AB1Y20_003383 [Prymnesium parvum]|uniref:Uncharacterized protein n=1 Tax=Prymnesium parvum TaxID=97485 RepID=A0AB34JDH7_PRYPA
MPSGGKLTLPCAPEWSAACALQSGWHRGAARRAARRARAVELSSAESLAAAVVLQRYVRARRRHAVRTRAALRLQSSARRRAAAAYVSAVRLASRCAALRRKAASRTIRAAARARYRRCVAAAACIQGSVRQWRQASGRAVGYLLRLCEYRLRCHARAAASRQPLSPNARRELLALPLWRQVDRLMGLANVVISPPAEQDGAAMSAYEGEGALPPRPSVLPPSLHTPLPHPLPQALHTHTTHPTRSTTTPHRPLPHAPPNDSTHESASAFADSPLIRHLDITLSSIRALIVGSPALTNDGGSAHLSLAGGRSSSSSPPWLAASSPCYRTPLSDRHVRSARVSDSSFSSVPTPQNAAMAASLSKLASIRASLQNLLPRKARSGGRLAADRPPFPPSPPSFASLSSPESSTPPSRSASAIDALLLQTRRDQELTRTILSTHSSPASSSADLTGIVDLTLRNTESVLRLLTSPELTAPPEPPHIERRPLPAAKDEESDSDGSSEEEEASASSFTAPERRKPTPLVSQKSELGCAINPSSLPPEASLPPAPPIEVVPQEDPVASYAPPPPDTPSSEGASTAAEQPAAEQPAAEQPVAEQPAAEQLEAEQPVAEQPVAEQPVADPPIAELPVPELPVPELPVPELPVPELPVPELPVAELRVAEPPAAELPVESAEPSFSSPGPTPQGPAPHPPASPGPTPAAPPLAALPRDDPALYSAHLERMAAMASPAAGYAAQRSLHRILAAPQTPPTAAAHPAAEAKANGAPFAAVVPPPPPRHGALCSNGLSRAAGGAAASRAAPRGSSKGPSGGSASAQGDRGRSATQLGGARRTIAPKPPPSSTRREGSDPALAAAVRLSSPTKRRRSLAEAEKPPDKEPPFFRDDSISSHASSTSRGKPCSIVQLSTGTGASPTLIPVSPGGGSCCSTMQVQQPYEVLAEPVA